MSDNSQSILLARRLEIDTLDEPLVYMRWDCHAVPSRGWRRLLERRRLRRRA